MTSFNTDISMNPLKTQADLRAGLLQLLAPLESHYVSGGLHLGNEGAHYSPRVALLEGWSRLLWGLAPLLAGGGSYRALEKHLAVLRSGIDPASPGYWGVALDKDQRLVEMAAIALSLMIAPGYFWEPLNTTERKQLYLWLSLIEQCELPANNWHFFRVLVCSAFRSLDLPVNEEAELQSFNLIESCYQGDGWYLDGSNGEYDLYNPFGFHFYGLIYAKLAGSRDPVRAANYRERARLFAPQFLNYFREDGSIVPYGRSLTYRFAAVSFFSACAFADLEALPWPVMKGVLLRNLRWWYSQPILDAAGLLSVGYAYPNLIMAEQYNSPGSPYWALKTFLILALGEDHPFWQAKEVPLPELPLVSSLPVPGYLINRSAEDVQLLCPGRYPGFEAVQAAAKYCKFAYSARFGFSVSHGSWTPGQTGCDSALILSEGDGYWRERRLTENQRSGPNWISSTWKPWPDVEIETILIGLGNWHLRIHRIKNARRLETIEGGFSIPRYRNLEPASVPKILSETEPESGGISILFPWGASRILDLSPGCARTGEALMMTPNLNVLESSGMVPVLTGTIGAGSSLLCCAVQAGDEKSVTLQKTPRIAPTSTGSIEVFDPNGSVIAIIPPRESKS